MRVWCHEFFSDRPSVNIGPVVGAGDLGHQLVEDRLAERIEILRHQDEVERARRSRCCVATGIVGAVAGDIDGPAT